MLTSNVGLKYFSSSGQQDKSFFLVYYVSKRDRLNMSVYYYMLYVNHCVILFSICYSFLPFNSLYYQ